MKKRFLKIFNSEIEYNSQKDEIMKMPYVVYLKDSKSVKYSGKLPSTVDYSKEYFTIEALEDGLTIKLTRNASYYRIDNEEWKSLSANAASPSINSGQTISVKMENPTISSSYGIGTFTINKKCNVKGNIMSLLYGDNFEGQTDLSGMNYAFYKLFYNCINLVNAKDLVLPATTLAEWCYYYMFDGCTSLTTTPSVLPATTLADYCYCKMFRGCTSLITALELPATTLAEGCYNYMFDGCTSLTTAPELKATTLAKGCYENMFKNCTSLITAPELKATTLTNYCYRYMFNGCTSLTTAPELQATTLADYCYCEMFSGCTSLTTAPELQATTLAPSCYSGMFGGCTSLTIAPELPATTLSSGCYNSMFSGCTSLTTAPELKATTLDSNCYYSMFQGCTSLTTAPELPATTLAENCYRNMFSNCTSLITTPELQATTLAVGCYNSMFSNCTSLTTAPELKATTLANGCYSSMFSGCSKLTTAPELPATTLVHYCYSSMFSNCTSLTTAPELKATKLATGCYSSMFNGCTSLTTAPELKVTSLAQYCYHSMFYGCSKLNYIKMLATNISASNCLYNWVYGVASNGAFVKNASMTSLPSGVHGIPNKWTVESHIVPYIINKTSETLTFYYSDGLYTPSSTVTAPLTNNFSQSQILSFKPNCDIIVDIMKVKTNYEWAMNKTLSSVMSELNISNVSKLEIIIKTVIIPEEDSYYYGYGVELVPEQYVEKDYFTIEALENGLTVSLYNNNVSNTLQYSIDGSNWNVLSPQAETPSINKGQKIQFVMINPTIAYGIGTFNISKKCNVKGNIMSLLYGDKFEEQNYLSQHPYAFYKLFNNCVNLVNAKDLVLQATTLSNYCYSYMFDGCTSLTTAPELPATTVAYYCYSYMFYGCTSLTTAPELPATTLAESCYQEMFGGCTSLTTAPELPATTLAEWCYYYMFRDCTSLVTAPELKATTLAEGCYSDMFYGCSNLNYIKMLATNISAYGCLYNWVRGVASSGTFVKNANMSSLPNGVSGIPSGWTVKNA